METTTNSIENEVSITPFSPNENILVEDTSLNTVENVISVEENSVESSPIVEQYQEVVQPIEIEETPSQTSAEVSSTNTLLIEEKLDKVYEINAMQFSASLIFAGLVSGVVCMYLLYKFISNFIDF